MAGAAKWLAGVTAGGVIGNFAYDKIAKRDIRVELEDLLPSFARSQLVPGSHHPDEGFHPDVFDALCGLTSILLGPAGSKSIDFRSLPLPKRSGDLLLLGGPISNELSMELHGHTYSGRKISTLPTRRSGFRWHFYYPASTPGEAAYSRYVAGRLEPKMRKVIIDTTAPGSSRELDSRCSHDGLIASDYLLITVQPNSLVPGSGTTIVEIADLQGQGDRACSALFASEAARRELKASVGHDRYFQALYEVPVSHDSRARTSTPGTPKLVGVARLGS